MKKFFLILCLIFLTSCNYQSKQQKVVPSSIVDNISNDQTSVSDQSEQQNEVSLSTTDSIKTEKNINAILLYIDLENENQEIDYNIFDPKSDDYIGTNDYIISSNAGFSIVKNIFYKTYYYYYGKDGIKNLEIDSKTTEQTKYITKDAFQIVTGITGESSSTWWLDDSIQKK